MDDHTRLAKIRALLPLQDKTTSPISQLLFTKEEIRERLLHLLPFKVFRFRRTRSVPISRFPEPIPDEILLAYDNARRTAAFREFSITWNLGGDEYSLVRRERDFFLVGKARIPGAVCYAILGQWHASSGYIASNGSYLDGDSAECPEILTGEDT